jgi:hypothetical protein
MLNTYSMWDPTSEAKGLHMNLKKHEPFSKLETINIKYVELRRITYMPLVTGRVYQDM